MKLKGFRELAKKLLKPLRDHQAKKLKFERKVKAAGREAFGKAKFDKAYKEHMSWDKNVNRLGAGASVGGFAGFGGFAAGKRQKKTQNRRRRRSRR